MRSKSSWWSKRHRDYKYKDKKKGHNYDFNLEGAKAIMELPCFYCTRPESRGMDRLDNDRGHERGNVVSCCENCNMILSTLPLSAKLELREPLRKMYEGNLLKDWQPIYKKKETEQEGYDIEIEVEDIDYCES